MNKNTFLFLIFGVLLLPATGLQAGVLVLTGSDADTFHTHAPYATALRDHLRQGSPLPLLVLGDPAATAAFSFAVGGVGIVTTASLTGIDLNLYAGLYLLSDSANGTGCCNADVALIVGFEAAINAFLDSGGSFGVQNYTGQAALDDILGTVSGANGSVHGFLGGLGGTNNYDDEAVTTAGSAAGFSNYVPLGSWGHQGFDMAFFNGLGFISLIDAPVYAPTVAAGLISLTLELPPPEVKTKVFTTLVQEFTFFPTPAFPEGTVSIRFTFQGFPVSELPITMMVEAEPIFCGDVPALLDPHPNLMGPPIGPMGTCVLFRVLQVVPDAFLLATEIDVEVLYVFVDNFGNKTPRLYKIEDDVGDCDGLAIDITTGFSEGLPGLDGRRRGSTRGSSCFVPADLMPDVLVNFCGFLRPLNRLRTFECDDDDDFIWVKFRLSDDCSAPFFTSATANISVIDVGTAAPEVVSSHNNFNEGTEFRFNFRRDQYRYKLALSPITGGLKEIRVNTTNTAGSHAVQFRCEGDDDDSDDN